MSPFLITYHLTGLRCEIAFSLPYRPTRIMRQLHEHIAAYATSPCRAARFPPLADGQPAPAAARLATAVTIRAYRCRLVFSVVTAATARKRCVPPL